MDNCGFCAAVEHWFGQPFKADGNFASWFMFVGMIFIIIWLWTRIVARIV